MPKKNVPDSEFKSEFADLKAIAREMKQAEAAYNRVVTKKRKMVATLAKKGANIGSMAAIFGVTRQALDKELRRNATTTKAAPAKAAAPTKAAATKAPAKKAASAKRVVRKKAAAK